jgi:hypothetical protein
VAPIVTTERITPNCITGDEMVVVDPFSQETGYGKSISEGFMFDPYTQRIFLHTWRAGLGSAVDIIVSESVKPMVEVRVEATYNEPSAMSSMSLCSYDIGGLIIRVSIILLYGYV